MAKAHLFPPNTRGSWFFLSHVEMATISVGANELSCIP
jgi:hypothetical protein